MTEDKIRPRTTRRKSALVLRITQGESMTSVASHQFDDLAPPEIEAWIAHGQSQHAPSRAKPEELRNLQAASLQYEAHALVSRVGIDVPPVRAIRLPDSPHTTFPARRFDRTAKGRPPPAHGGPPPQHC